MGSEKIRVAIITNIITNYREGFYDRLFRRDDLEVTVYCQERIPGMNLTSIHEKYGERIKIIEFWSANKEKIVWQFLPWREIAHEYDTVFVLGNPRILSSLIFASGMRLIGKKVVIWTQAHSCRNNAFTEKIRLFWCRWFKYLFVYTDAEVNYLRGLGFKNNIISGMNNGLDQKVIDVATAKWPAKRLREWRRANGLENRMVLLTCARLIAKNKFFLLIEAVPKILETVPDLLCGIIGDGEEREHLEEMVKKSGLEQQVRFVGSLYREDELTPWFLSASLLVHPAAIGLTLMHAYGYGLPVVTHGEARLHNPEYSAFQAELTGRVFEKDNVQNLADTVSGLLHDHNTLARMKINAFETVRNKYNVDIMVDRFADLARRTVGL